MIDETDDLEPDGPHYLEQIDLVQFKDYSFSYPSAERKGACQALIGPFRKDRRLGLLVVPEQERQAWFDNSCGSTQLVRESFWSTSNRSWTTTDTPSKKKIGYVSQEHILFSKSIRENIALGKKGASQDDLVEAVAQAAFADDLERMSHGMDTLIGEKGVSVSGGQKQRISLARAFLRDADLLLLDDSLSGSGCED